MEEPLAEQTPRFRDDCAGVAAPERGRDELYRRASLLALVTIFYNCAEGLVSVVFGMADETIALFGFGLDSFVEVVSGVGIWHMVRRVRRGGAETADTFERTALRVTGTAFYILAAGLAVTAAVRIAGVRSPESTVWGIVVASVSIVTMWFLIALKTRVGRGLKSQAVLADANCTKACLMLSAALLVSSVGYEMTGVRHLDTAGAVFIAWFAIREGREAFAKSRGETCGCESG